MSYRILIAEDYQLLRQGLRAMIEDVSDFSVIGEAVDGKEAVQKAVQLQPDLVVMDLSMPGLNGIEATIQIKRRMPQVRILALTVYHTDEYVREALKAGADGYVLKDTSYDELLQAVRSVIAGKRYISPDVSVNLLDNLLANPAGHKPAATVWDTLTARERSVFKLIAEGHTNRSAAEYLNLSPKTVEKHRASLMHKLDLKTAVELTLLAVELGLVEKPSVGSGSKFRDTAPPPLVS
ncbi:MAG: response regulator transcription factor [Betaproteobacteria bacterium]|nr:response regulator transcription factor [Betaproteobacteria bacterium]MDE2047013.1 response regulator transcription factor [Betaproteobacteria bacterium]